ncbi:MAG: PIN domain-containing protein [Proteobacteria bacterium]|nr:PIN domain-containing protein [Pseudomonadota bacterium]MBI3496425.1 PIN domain-containing protein [Pseudomonadota bacterium]
MSAERFTLDTNILVYSVDSKAGTRHMLALEIVNLAVERDCCLTLQALSEFYAAVTRKGIVPPMEAAAQAEDWLEIFPAAAASQTSVKAALASVASGRASYWDALLLATAAEAGCTTILTEDLSDGSTFDGVRIHNPFARNGLSGPARRLLSVK